MPRAMAAPPPALLAPPDAREAALRAVEAARERGRPVLLSWTRALERAEPLAFLAGSDAPRAFFAAPGGDAMAGAGEAVVVEAGGPGRFDAVRARAEALLAHAVVAAPQGAPGPRFLGGFAFGPDAARDALWAAFPPARFALPSVALVRRDRGAWVTVNRLVEGREEPGDLARHVAVLAERASAATAMGGRAGAPLPAFGSQVAGREAWLAAVRAALRSIAARELAKVVLARRVAVPLAGALPGPEAAQRLARSYPECFLYLVEPRRGHAFLGASPEPLAGLRGRAVESAAVAGSAARGADPREDEALADALRASAKERIEHALVREHVLRRLRELGAVVEAPSEPSVMRLRNVQHLHTPVRGELRGPLHVLDVAAALHPTPAVAGAPTEAALDHLARHEDFDRGWYAGAVGWFDAVGAGEFAVALRCALLVDDEAWLFAGAGIVAGAQPEREWDETALKLQPMLEALGCR